MFSFSENLASSGFLLPLFWDLPFCFITCDMVIEKPSSTKQLNESHRRCYSLKNEIKKQGNLRKYDRFNET